MITDNQITENQMGNLQSLEFEQGGVISILDHNFSYCIALGHMDLFPKSKIYCE